MRLTKISVRNFRSIKNIEGMRLETLQAFVGENNAGKSNILKAISCFLTSGAGGVKPTDFNDPENPIVIEAEFTGMLEGERRNLRQYMIGDKLILQKHLSVQSDPESGKEKVVTAYHGYQAEPRDWWLSAEKVNEREGAKPNWKQIAEDHGILDYVQIDGKVNKASYKEGLERLLVERDDIEYEPPVLGRTQALGIPQNLLSNLPEFYLLPAITDYSDEIDKRSSSTVFRKLMGELSDRIIKADPRYREIEAALNTLHNLLNCVTDENGGRLTALSSVEENLAELIAKLMPSVKGVELSVSIEEPKELFSRGVALKVNDGVTTDVLDKGHGLQRSVVFGLLQMLMKTTRERDAAAQQRPIILGIEEPELYIHPHCQRLIYNVLKEFAGITDEEVQGIDQVIYTTHSPAFVDVGNYERIGVVRKFSIEQGTTIQQCEAGVLGSPDEKKVFKMLTSFGLKHNELFFSRDVILVEGVEDEIGIIATARKLGRIKELPEEMGLSIVVTDGKGDIPKFQKVMNAFGFGYGVLLELDGNPEAHPQTAPIIANLNGNRVAKIPNKLETLLGLGRHFDDARHAKNFFADPANINEAMERILEILLPVEVEVAAPAAEQAVQPQAVAG